MIRISRALEPWIGRPYVPVGRGPGYDCWTLVQAIYSAAGAPLPPMAGTAEEIAERLAGERVARDWRIVAESHTRRGRGLPLRWLMAPRVLDVVEMVLFGEPHVGVLASEDGNALLHAIRPGVDSAAVDLRRAPWSGTVIAIYRPPEGQEATL